MILKSTFITFHFYADGLIQQVSGMETLPKDSLRRLKMLQGIRSKAEKEIFSLLKRECSNEEKQV